MIHSGQMTRQKALEKLRVPPQEVIGPFNGWNLAEKKNYDDYPNSKKIRQLVMKAYAVVRD